MTKTRIRSIDGGPDRGRHRTNLANAGLGQGPKRAISFADDGRGKGNLALLLLGQGRARGRLQVRGKGYVPEEIEGGDKRGERGGREDGRTGGREDGRTGGREDGRTGGH